MSKQSMITIILDQIMRENQVSEEQAAELKLKLDAHSEEELYSIANVFEKFGTKGIVGGILR
jgi:hypothetical protein